MSSTPSTIVCQQRRASLALRLIDYVELTKPRIAVLELATVAVAAFLAAPEALSAPLLFNALMGTALVAASASIFNQWLERQSDAHMPRTADRPLPAGRISSVEAVTLGLVTLAAGMAQLALVVNLPTAAVGLASWLLYVAVYTPLKSRTTANTLVGAVAGALPVWMGWLATGQPLDVKATALFLIVFLWQFPHFMAIAWIYRQQYGAAGAKMLTVVDPSGARAGAQAVMAATVLIPVSLLPAVMPMAGSALICFGGVLVLGLGQLLCAVAFLIRRSETSAQRLLWASLIYLPAVLMLLMLTTPV
jgi:heme o synthase